MAFFRGWALPTTALIRWSPIAQKLAYYEPQFGLALLAWAAIGAVTAWFALLVPEGDLIVQKEDKALLHSFRLWGFVIIVCAFVFSISTVWVGTVRSGDLSSMSFSGLIPFSDAEGYVAGAFDFGKNGIWSDFNLRRPMASAFRTALLFLSGYSYSGMLFLQTCFLAAVSYFATLAIMRWRGFWSGLAFLGLTYTYVRAFVPTALTEPLGLCWALFSIPFFIEAFRTRSLPSALLAFGATTVALMSRMGAMFTIPAVIIWIFWQFGQTWRQRLAAGFAAVLILGGILAANFALTKGYGSGQDITGDNFSYVLCGLTIDTTWEGCPRRIQEEGGQLPAGEAATAKALYSMAWQNFERNPDVLIRRLLSASYSFLANLPNILFSGYGNVVKARFIVRSAILCVSIVGLFFAVLRRRERGELLFWALLWSSIIASASIVYFDDGNRVLAVSYVIIWLFFAVGFANPMAAAPVNEDNPPRLNRYGIVCFAVMTFLLFGTPWIAHSAYKLPPSRQVIVRQSSSDPNQAVVFGGRRMSGLLVVPDGYALRSDVPTVNLKTFLEIVKRSRIEEYQGLVNPQTPTLPFGFVYAPRLDPTDSNFQYIVPPEVIERQEVPAWRFDVEEWQLKPPHGSYWFYVRHAEPVP